MMQADVGNTTPVDPLPELERIVGDLARRHLTNGTEWISRDIAGCGRAPDEFDTILVLGMTADGRVLYRYKRSTHSTSSLVRDDEPDTFIRKYRPREV